ncbi:hypothetical protein [Phenylobacterium sp.]|uniref:hypothetical protein n=1 Tax=Phenylobacterium sp. TaxID=1871053 RepID=UPI002F946B8E
MTGSARRLGPGGAILVLALAGCATADGFTIPAWRFREDFRNDYIPRGPPDPEGMVTDFEFPPHGISAARCAQLPGADVAECRWTYRDMSGDRVPVAGRFRRDAQGRWRYVPDSARYVGPDA